MIIELSTNVSSKNDAQKLVKEMYTLDETKAYYIEAFEEDALLSNFHRQYYRVLVWETEKDSENDDGSKAIAVYYLTCDTAVKGE